MLLLFSLVFLVVELHYLLVCLILYAFFVRYLDDHVFDHMLCYINAYWILSLINACWILSLIVGERSRNSKFSTHHQDQSME